MFLGEPIIGPLTVPEVVGVVIGIFFFIMWIICKMKPPRPPAVPGDENLSLCGQRLPNQVVL
jgi:hypothetical protein